MGACYMLRKNTDETLLSNASSIFFCIDYTIELIEHLPLLYYCEKLHNTM